MFNESIVPLTMFISPILNLNSIVFFFFFFGGGHIVPISQNRGAAFHFAFP